jgi:hypothetical protein
MPHEYVTNFAPEAVAYAKALRGDPDAEEVTLANLLKAKREARVAMETVKAARPTDDEAADINAKDMLEECGIDPDTDAGELIYCRAYVATMLTL